MKDSHVQLPEDTFRLPRTGASRREIEICLLRRQKFAVYAAISAYAAEMAGTGADLDPSLEAASLEHLAESERTSE